VAVAAPGADRIEKKSRAIVAIVANLFANAYGHPLENEGSATKLAALDVHTLLLFLMCFCGRVRAGACAQSISNVRALQEEQRRR